MNEERLQELLAAEGLGSLDPEDRRALDEALEGDPRLRQQLDDLREAAESLGFGVDPSDPEPSIRVRVLRMAADSRSGGGRRAAAWRGNPLAAAFAGVAGLAVAAAVVIAVLLGGRIAELEDRTGRARDRTTEQVAVLEALAMGRGNAVRLVGTENAPEAVGFLLMTSDERVAVLVCSGLERMPSGKAYQLWLNRADTKMSGGLVNADYYGFALLVVRSPEPISRFQTFGMTIEPEGGSAGPTGAKVMGGGFQ